MPDSLKAEATDADQTSIASEIQIPALELPPLGATDATDATRPVVGGALPPPTPNAPNPSTTWAGRSVPPAPTAPVLDDRHDAALAPPSSDRFGTPSPPAGPRPRGRDRVRPVCDGTHDHGPVKDRSAASALLGALRSDAPADQPLTSPIILDPLVTAIDAVAEPARGILDHASTIVPSEFSRGYSIDGSPPPVRQMVDAPPATGPSAGALLATDGDGRWRLVDHTTEPVATAPIPTADVTTTDAAPTDASTDTPTGTPTGDAAVGARSVDRGAFVRRALMVGVAGLAVLVVLRPTSMVAPGGTPTTVGVTPAAGADVVAGDLVAQLLQTKEISAVTAGYVVGTGIVVRMQVTGVEAPNVADWVAKQMVPMATRLADVHLGPTEALVVVIDGDGVPPAARVGRVAPAKAADPTAYTFGVATQWSSATSTTVVRPTTTLPPTGLGKVDNTAPTVATTAAPAGDLKAPATDAFDKGATDWKALAGRWRATDGGYHQLDAAGFDLITTWKVSVPADYSYQATIKADGGALAGGLMINQPALGARKLATVIDIADNGTGLRWGHYDDAGKYVPDGGAALLVPLDPTAAVTLKIEVKAGTVTVFVADTTVGTFVPFGSPGFIGLAVSQAAITFDDVAVTPL